jgi:hypothetical protein
MANLAWPIQSARDTCHGLDLHDDPTELLGVGHMSRDDCPYMSRHLSELLATERIEERSAGEQPSASEHDKRGAHIAFLDGPRHVLERTMGS